MDFNKAQLKAVETVDKDVLVSAGAGSGKTRVLVERFCRLVRDGLARPDEILTVTFTEKAAKEMKGRIIARFRDWARETGDPRFEAAAGEMEAAYIGTIHSFAMRALKENAFEAGIDPGFSVLTEAQADALKEQVLGRANAAGFTAGRPEYIDLLTEYGRRETDAAIKNTHAQLASLARDDASAAPLEAGELSEAAARYFSAADAIANYGGKTTEKLAAALEAFNSLYPAVAVAMTAAVTDLERLGTAEFARTFDWDRFELISRAEKIIPGNVGGADFKDGAAKPAAEALRLFRLALLAPASAHYSGCLAAVTTDFSREYEAAKRRMGRLDFNDLLLTVHRLFMESDGEPSATAREYKNRFKYVMIDEFQDTNALQIAIVKAVSSPERFFAVGDVKQSIYAFQHSDVSIFLGHQRAIGAGAGELISMGDNYRSRPEIIDFVNGFFSELWREETEFDFEELLSQSGLQQSTRQDVELVWVEKSEKADTFSAVDKERMAEARAATARIRELLDGDGPRPYSPGDIMILFRQAGSIKTYERALADAGLDYYVVSGRGFYETREVRDMLNLLRVVDNPLDDVAMAAVLRSPMVGVSEDTLWWMTRRPGPAQADGVIETGASAGYGKLYRALLRASGNDSIDPADRERLAGFRDTLGPLHAARSESRLARLFGLAVRLTSYDLKLLAMDQGKRRYANLRKLAEEAGGFGAASSLQLPDFIRHLERMAVTAQKEGEAPTESEESPVIRLMTVHGSKGLQAPVVFVADLGRKMKVGQSEKAFVFDGGPGVAAKVRGPEGAWYPSRQFEEAAQRAKERDIAEEKRLFYVAATRAEELLVLCGAPAFKGRDPKKTSYADYQTWMSWLEAVAGLNAVPESDDITLELGSWRLRLLKGSPVVPRAKRSETIAEKYRSQLLAGEHIPANEDRLIDVRALTAPPAPAHRRSVDLTVSAVIDYLSRPDQHDPEHRTEVPGHRESTARGADTPRGASEVSRVPDAAAIGSAVHDVLASIDWTHDPEEQMADLIALREEPIREHIRDNCARFLRSSWPARIRAAEEVFQEAPFSLELENCRLFGRIDLLFREPGGWVIVDYKTGAGLDKESYATQVRLYGLALEKALGEAPAEVALVSLGGDRDFVQKVDPDSLAKTEALLKEAAGRIAAEDFPAVTGDGWVGVDTISAFAQRV